MPSSTESSTDADAELIARISRGDEQAFVQLYERFSRPLYSMAIRILQNPQDAEDILQLSFLQVWKRAASFEIGRASVFTWMVMIMRSKAIDRVRQRLRQARIVDEQSRTLSPHESHSDAFPNGQPSFLVVNGDSSPETRAGSDPTQGLDDQERSATIRVALNKIPSEQRDAIEMAFFKGLTQREISEVLNTPLGTIKARIRRGMLRLRDYLEGRL